MIVGRVVRGENLRFSVCVCMSAKCLFSDVKFCEAYCFFHIFFFFFKWGKTGITIIDFIVIFCNLQH